jgi:Gpi18-like mannosyltransferase
MKKFLADNKQEIIVILVALFSRLLTVFIGVVFITNSLNSNVDDLGKAFVHWDGGWYLDIVENGYDNNFSDYSPTSPECNMGDGSCQRNFAFFPLFPISTSIISSLLNIDHKIAGILLSNILFCFSALILFKLTQYFTNSKVAWYTIACLLVFPTSYLFSAFMSESLYLFLFLASILLGIKQKWVMAGCTGALLSATRNTGIMIIPILIAIYIEKKYQDKKFPGINLKLLKRLDLKVIFSILIAGSGLLAFMIYLYNLVGDPLAFINIQRYWDKPVNGISPLLAIPYSFINWQLETSLKIHIYNLGYFFLVTGLGLWGFLKKKLPLSQLAVLAIVFIPMLSGSMLALPRYISVLYPMYMLAGIVLAKYRKISGLLLLLSAIMSIIMLNAYVHGLWITV